MCAGAGSLRSCRRTNAVLRRRRAQKGIWCRAERSRGSLERPSNVHYTGCRSQRFYSQAKASTSCLMRPWCSNEPWRITRRWNSIWVTQDAWTGVCTNSKGGLAVCVEALPAVVFPLMMNVQAVAHDDHAFALIAPRHGPHEARPSPCRTDSKSRRTAWSGGSVVGNRRSGVCKGLLVDAGHDGVGRRAAVEVADARHLHGKHRSGPWSHCCTR